MKKVAILGTGAYGLSLSLMFLKNHVDILMWTISEEEKKLLEETRKTPKLEGIEIPKEIKFTNNIKECIEDRELIVLAVPAKFADDTLKKIEPFFDKKRQHILIASKGIEQDTCLFIDQIAFKILKTRHIAVISGPTFAIDIAHNNPVALALGASSIKTRKLVYYYLHNETLKLRHSSDMRGLEICGSIKNVIAIASGILTGLGYSDSTQAFLITESLHDIKNFIRAYGGKGKTILTFAGFGDLLLTCTSVKSRNFSFGLLLGKREKKEVIDKYKKETTIEGLYTLDSIYKLIKDKDIEMPIIDLIYDIVYNGKNPDSLAEFLITKE